MSPTLKDDFKGWWFRTVEALSCSASEVELRVAEFVKPSHVAVTINDANKVVLFFHSDGERAVFQDMLREQGAQG